MKKKKRHEYRVSLTYFTRARTQREVDRVSKDLQEIVETYLCTWSNKKDWTGTHVEVEDLDKED